MREKIFFVEDDEDIYELIEATLAVSEYDIEGFLEPLAMLERLKYVKPDLIILDLMLPNMNGYEVLKYLNENKEYSHIPVIILSAKSNELDIVKGLDLGACDYITKPFGILEFSSRVKTNLRKTSKSDLKADVIEFNGLKLDDSRHKCTYNDITIELTVKEYKIVKMLMENLQTVVTREDLLNNIWGFEQIAETRTLDMHIKSIRSKFFKVASNNFIETVRGVGYIINE